MSTLYFECKMGAAGDMLSAALLDLCDNRDDILKKLNTAGIPGTTFNLTDSEKCGVMGKHLEVKVNGEEEESVDSSDHHHHEHEHSHGSPEHSHEHGHTHTHKHHHHNRGMHDIEHIVSHLLIDDDIKQDVINVYKLIAEAESSVHGMEVSEIHFHEVGSMDAIADITATCLIMNELKPDRVVASPIHVGSGTVKCAHGILPVPAPATAMLLKGIPSYSKEINGELCTPTGAALLRYFASSFGDQPLMSVDKIGYGMGKKDFPVANCVRAFLGEETGAAKTADDLTDTIAELVCNLDDMTPEAIGFATERLMEEGALDVFTNSIGMKKNRPGVMLTVLCKEDVKDDMVRKIFKYTTTIGIRENICKRYILKREEKVVTTPDGDVRVKEVSGYGVKREKKEYEDLAQIARNKNTGINF